MRIFKKNKIVRDVREMFIFFSYIDDRFVLSESGSFIHCTDIHSVEDENK